MIGASGILAGVVASAGDIGFHPVYVATAIGCGSLVGSWMNDSGFWIYARMSGLTEMETLKSWTPGLAVVGISGFLATLVLAWLLPLA
jgi:H+/gluconate symporter-like permease